MKNVVAISLLVSLTSFFSCSEEGNAPGKTSVPKLTTGVVTDITPFTAVASGEITDDGNSLITESGFVYTTQNRLPTTSDIKLVFSGGGKVLNGVLAGLDSETIYFVRAYATNSEGTGYGNLIPFNTAVQLPTTEGLVAHYTFEENVLDQVGDNHIEVGIPLGYVYFNPRNQQAVGLSADKQTVLRIGNTFDFERKTICAWVRVDQSTSTPTVILASDNPNKQYGNLAIGTQIDIDARLKIIFTLSGNTVKIPVTIGSWYHLAIVGDAKKYEFYLNGLLISEGTFSDYIQSASGFEETIVGASRNYVNHFTGAVDNLRIYNRALTAMEIKIISKY